MLQGTSHARAGFERFQSIYSNVRAREDAENRAARTIADDLKTRLAAYLSGRGLRRRSRDPHACTVGDNPAVSSHALP